MNASLFTIYGYMITPWQVFGMVGIVLFSLRWVVQVVASARARKSVIPPHFWYLSAGGSCILIVYFALGQRDLVGVISNILPLSLAAYNLFLVYKFRKTDIY
jgi:lipid-A-disaccharide synthase-like uncharacterized protein